MSRILLNSILILVASLIAAPAAAEVAVFLPERDATIYQDDAGAVANGAGDHLFIARIATGNRRRALLYFDVSEQIPPGSTILAASLTLNVSRVPPSVNPVGTELHRVLTAWSEGPTDPPGQEGIPAPSQDGDVTWIHTTFPGELWGTEGGDFDPVERASVIVGDEGPVTWGSTPEMVADVQEWLDAPETNHGWILVGDGFGTQTAKRLDSREHPDPARRPQLVVDFLPPPVTEIPTLSTWGLVLLAAWLLVSGVRRLR